MNIPIIKARTSVGKVDRWAIIDELIRDYTKVHPYEVGAVVEANKMLKSRLFDTKYGKGKETNLRHAMDMPVGLTILLKQNFPDLFSDKKNFHKFCRKYKGFTVPDKI